MVGKDIQLVKSNSTNPRGSVLYHVQEELLRGSGRSRFIWKNGYWTEIVLVVENVVM